MFIKLKGVLEGMGRNLSDLQHVRVPTGGDVYVLDTGAVIDSEAEAMIQALHSRSTGGLISHLETLEDRGADNFMNNFYVGYGHKSIGDCGTTTLFVEGVSMLVAKAIQDSPLYNGQEASTRYVDFSKQRFVDPTETWKGRELLESQRDFYLRMQEPTRANLREQYPIGEGEKEAVYEKAINARAFDITRSLLPAGASTNLAWHTNLRQAADRLLFLRHHPLREVRSVAGAMEEALQVAHQNSFGHKRYPATEEYQDVIASSYFYYDEESPEGVEVDFTLFSDDFEGWKESYGKLFSGRPPKTELPRFLAQMGEIDVRFQLDYGSFRDIQRHRAINQRMPLLTTELGFNSWYLENFPREHVEEIEQNYLEDLREKIQNLGISPEEEQYFIPMGFNTSNRFTGNLPAVVYMVELRDSRFVHPTLQRVASEIGGQITENLGIPLHVDSEPNRFDIKRGEQDIVVKED